MSIERLDEMQRAFPYMPAIHSSDQTLSMFLLETERLLFREHRRSDLEDYCALEADAEVRRYVGGAPRPREIAARRFRERFLKNAARKLALRATIFKADGRYIGYSGLYPNFRPAVRCGEKRCWRSVWLASIGAEAWPLKRGTLL
jgi:RimJ/RimL family protein N-acetyltransferase